MNSTDFHPLNPEVWFKEYQEKPKDEKWLIFDLDGTLTVEVEGFDYAKRTPVRNRISAINTISDKHKIIIWTSRLEEDRAVTEAWLEDNKVVYDHLFFCKPRFDILVDDLVQNAAGFKGMFDNNLGIWGEL